MSNDYTRLIERLDEIASSVLRIEANMIDLQAQLDTLVPRSRRSALPPTAHNQEVLGAALGCYLDTAQPVGYDAFTDGMPMCGIPNGAPYGYYMQLVHLCLWLAQRYPQSDFTPQRIRRYLMLTQWHQTRLVMRDALGSLHRKRYWFKACAPIKKSPSA